MMMKFCFKYYAIFFCSFLFCTITSAQENNKKEIQIHFRNVAGNSPLQLNELYTNNLGEKYSVSSLRYYISNIILIDKNNNSANFFKDNYFLIDQSDTNTQNISLQSTLKEITQINFMIGIDSLKNVQGVQTGVLDPAKGMFWVWNTGYVMAKLEGYSEVVNAPRHAFSLHIGGFKNNQNSVREIQLDIKSNPDIINIFADINCWFKGIHHLSLKENFFCHEPGDLAMKYADNYATMFSIHENKE